jgi:hypothetical protein
LQQIELKQKLILNLTIMKTKKNKVTNLLKTGILFLGVSLLLWNCEQETVFEEIEETPIAQVYKFEPKDIPDISSQIENRSRKNVFSRSSNTTEPYWIDDQNILGAIDSLENKSFFYRLYFNNMPTNTFYNIVVTERVDDTIDPFVLAYEFENGIKKSMKVYGLEPFLDALVERENKKTSNRSFNRDYEYWNEPIDITDCGDLLSGNSGGNSSNNNSGGTGTATNQNGPTNSGNGNYVSYGSTTVINYGGGNSGGGSSIQWGTGNFDFPPANALRSSNYNRGDDRVICPDGEIIIVENGENLEGFIEQNVWDTQDPYDKWNKLTDCEKDFFKSNPQHLYTARGNKAEAEKVAWERFGNCNTPNGRPMLNTIGDAYRHAYFAALNTHNMGHTNAKSLGDAHECDTPSNKLDQKQMDLHNNAWGYHYGSTISTITESQFYTTFMNAFNSGQIKILQECN